MYLSTCMHYTIILFKGITNQTKLFWGKKRGHQCIQPCCEPRLIFSRDISSKMFPNISPQNHYFNRLKNSVFVLEFAQRLSATDLYITGLHSPIDLSHEKYLQSVWITVYPVRKPFGICFLKYNDR